MCHAILKRHKNKMAKNKLQPTISVIFEKAAPIKIRTRGARTMTTASASRQPYPILWFGSETLPRLGTRTAKINKQTAEAATSCATRKNDARLFMMRDAANEKRATADSRREPRQRNCQRQRRLGQLLGIAQRTVVAVFDCPSQRFSPRKLIPVNVKTLGDHLHLQRIKVNLSQSELAQMAGVSTRTVRKWECGRVCPSEDHWQTLARILHVDSRFAADPH